MTSMEFRARSVREEAAEQSFRTKANLVTSLGRVPDLPGSFKTPENARSETARILFRAFRAAVFSGFQVNRSWIRFSWTHNAAPHLLAKFAR